VDSAPAAEDRGEKYLDAAELDDSVPAELHSVEASKPLLTLVTVDTALTVNEPVPDETSATAFTTANAPALSALDVSSKIPVVEAVIDAFWFPFAPEMRNRNGVATDLVFAETLTWSLVKFVALPRIVPMDASDSEAFPSASRLTL
jgi:hypothetical protein